FGAQFPDLPQADVHQIGTVDGFDAVVVFEPGPAGHALVVVDDDGFLARLRGEDGGAGPRGSGSDNGDVVHADHPPFGLFSCTLLSSCSRRKANDGIPRASRSWRFPRSGLYPAIPY